MSGEGVAPAAPGIESPGERHSPQSTVIDGDGFMPIELLVGGLVYVWQGDVQLTMGRAAAAELAAALTQIGGVE